MLKVSIPLDDEPVTQTGFSVPADEKPPSSMMLPPPCLTVGTVISASKCAGFEPDMLPLMDKISIVASSDC